MDIRASPHEKARQPETVVTRLMRHDNADDGLASCGAARLQSLAQCRQSRPVRLHYMLRVLARWWI